MHLSNKVKAPITCTPLHLCIFPNIHTCRCTLPESSSEDRTQHMEHFHINMCETCKYSSVNKHSPRSAVHLIMLSQLTLTWSSKQSYLGVEANWTIHYHSSEWHPYESAIVWATAKTKYDAIPQVSTSLSHLESLTGHNGYDHWHTL